MRLVLIGFWVAVAVGLFIGPFRPADGTSTTPAGALALMLAGWNLVRWRAVRSAVTAAPSLLERPTQAGRGGTTEYHPEFDFTDRDRDHGRG